MIGDESADGSLLEYLRGHNFKSTINSMVSGAGNQALYTVIITVCYCSPLTESAGAGVVCTIVCAPLDVLKVRLQVQGQLGLNKYGGGFIANTLQIIREEGMRGAFKGVGPALFTVPIFWAVYWPIYNKMKAFFQEKPNIPTHVAHLLSAISAGAVGDIITNPFWVTRTRLQTLSMHGERALSANISSLEMVRTIYREEGWKAFYKGLGASFLGLTHVAIQFPLCQ